MPVIFFDIGGTLATPRLDEGGQLIGFTVLSGVRPALEALRARSLRMGIISHRGNSRRDTVIRELRKSGLLDFFEPGLIILAKKDSSIPFQAAAATAGVPPDECMFVGESNQERTHALEAGFANAIPHPSLVVPVLDGDALFFASLSRSSETPDAPDVDAWTAAFKDSSLVPLRVASDPCRHVEVIVPTSAIARLRYAGFKVDVRGQENEPQKSDLYLIYDDRPVPAGVESAEAFSSDFITQAGLRDVIVGSVAGGLLVALPARVSIEDLHFPDPLHGHNERLIPDRSLLRSLTKTITTSETTIMEIRLSPKLDLQELEVLGGINATSLRQLHERYIGIAPLTSSEGPVVSRHIGHSDNRRVSDALVGHFSEVGGDGLVVRRHPFKYEEIRLESVEAELPGEMPESFVLISAHLDSTANSGAGFDPATDPAPGSDDDASGVAAVLAATRAISNLSLLKKPKRTVRFLLFNAEEQGKVGSRFYAGAQAAEQADITAVFQMDMIGFRIEQTEPSRNFEVHAGYNFDPEVEQHSLALAQLIHEVIPQVSPTLNTPQVYPNTPGGLDPADGRSDHVAFQERGYAACVMCEDFFAGPKPDSPVAQPNPNYHRSTDKEINYEYAADIARAVTAAAWNAANM